MRVLGIDPGKTYFGWGLVEDGQLLAVGLRAGRDVSGLPLADVVVVEKPQVYRGRSEPRSIRDLTLATGELIGGLRAHAPRILTPQPAEWKGQVPKDIHQSRIRAAIGEQGRRVLAQSGLSRVHLGHALDGVGLALWGEKNLAHGRQCPPK